MSNNVASLINDLEILAVEHGEAMRAGDDIQANRLNDKLSEVAARLRSFWPKSKAGLEQLLTNSEESVRLWAAVTLLPVSEQDAVDALEQLRAKGNITSLSARALLDLHKKGLA